MLAKILAPLLVALVVGPMSVSAQASPPGSGGAATAEERPLAAIGGKLAYIDTSGNLVEQDLTSGKTIQLASAGANTLSLPAWSPDGSLVAFAAWPPPPPGFAQHSGDVYVVPADASAPAHRVTPNSDTVGQISWLPDSQVLVFGFGYQDQHNVMRVNADGSYFQALYDGAGGAFTYNDPSVSPDGQLVATVRTQNPGGGAF